jgi:hypothetical protein
MGPILTGGWKFFLATFGGVLMVWFRGRVARQRSAKPFTAVRIRSKPRFKADKMR